MNPTTIELPAHENATILEQIEAAGLSPKFACRAGFCGDCRSRLISGEIEYIDAPLGYVDDGEILPCCSIAVTAVRIEVSNDV